MPHNSEKIRLDSLLVARGLSESRERAQRALMAGLVFVAGQRVEKPGTRVAADVEIEVRGGERYVSRGGLKLEGALDAFGIDPAGKVCLDVGASTGGFTDCLLQRGAVRVHALDVGHGQLHWRIRSDERVWEREKINCRNLRFEDVGERVDIAVADVSFISLTLILPPAFELITANGVMVVLIKPQFELSRAQVGRGGIVTDPGVRYSAVEKIERFVVGTMRRTWGGVIESPITGVNGNVEFLACIRP
jgi:23S rRNA (cytidine1920-2'-O)/16S rRNA (cytidine1409-2'-O)-methyltransferase